MYSILLQAASAPNQSSIMSFLPIVGIIVVFYFFMIRPQMKKQKEAKKFVEQIKKGDKVVTIGGIVGKITEVTDNGYLIESENTKLKVLKSAISMENSAALNKPETTK